MMVSVKFCDLFLADAEAYRHLICPSHTQTRCPRGEEGSRMWYQHYQLQRSSTWGLLTVFPGDRKAWSFIIEFNVFLLEDIILTLLCNKSY